MYNIAVNVTVNSQQYSSHELQLKNDYLTFVQKKWLFNWDVKGSKDR